MASQLRLLDGMWKRAMRAVARHVPASSAPWYRRAEVWLLLLAIILPFGWILALGRVAWIRAAARRERQRAPDDAQSPAPAHPDRVPKA